ncbi:MAG: iron ABC transporter permease [Clostridiaceae bacterium]|nr:iron ABC transporter permease [Clostridiaceae bacterium]
MYKEDEMRINNKNKSNTVLLYIIASVLLFIVFLVSISAGSVGITLSDTIKLLTDHISDSGHNLAINESLKTILFNVRMPRVVLAAMVGAALSVSGAAMQGLLKNPLAEGSTLGITSGGALGAVLSLTLGIHIPVFKQLGLAITSIIFSFLSIVLILSLTYKIDKGLSTQTIILTGVIFSMFTSSLTSLLVTLSGDSLKQVVFWSLGSFSGRGWSHVKLMLPFFVAGTAVLLTLSHELNAFSLGEEQARYLGVNTKKIKLLILALVSMLVGISVSVSGTIGFVGLVVPHITRLLAGPNFKKLLPLSVLFGASFLMLTDLVSRTVLSPRELPIGVVTSFIGAFLFIYIFYNYSNKKSR